MEENAQLLDFAPHPKTAASKKAQVVITPQQYNVLLEKYMMLRERFQLINNEEKMKYLQQIDEYKYTIKLLQS